MHLKLHVNKQEDLAPSTMLNSGPVPTAIVSGNDAVLDAPSMPVPPTNPSDLSTGGMVMSLPLGQLGLPVAPHTHQLQ